MNFELFLQLEPLVTNGMSTFQMENFVVNESITPYRKLRQALMEVKARMEVLANGDFDLQENELKRKKARQEFETLTGIDKELKEVEIKRLDYIINRTSTMRQQQTREAEFFMGIASELIDQMGGVEKVKQCLNDPKYHYEQETDYWTKRLSRSVCSDFINFGTITKGVVESISCLPLEQQKEIIQVALNQQAQLTELLDNTRDTLLVSRD